MWVLLELLQLLVLLEFPLLQLLVLFELLLRQLLVLFERLQLLHVVPAFLLQSVASSLGIVVPRAMY